MKWQNYSTLSITSEPKDPHNANIVEKVNIEIVTKIYNNINDK